MDECEAPRKPPVQPDLARWHVPRRIVSEQDSDTRASVISRAQQAGQTIPEGMAARIVLRAVAGVR